MRALQGPPLDTHLPASPPAAPCHGHTPCAAQMPQMTTARCESVLERTQRTAWTSLKAPRRYVMALDVAHRRHCSKRAVLRDLAHNTSMYTISCWGARPGITIPEAPPCCRCNRTRGFYAHAQQFCKLPAIASIRLGSIGHAHWLRDAQRVAANEGPAERATIAVGAGATVQMREGGWGGGVVRRAAKTGGAHR